MEKEVNEEKRAKFMEFAGKRVNNVLHDIQILEPMSRSSAYDFTREDINEMFQAMEDALAEAKSEFEKKFEEKARASKKVFSFGTTPAKTVAVVSAPVTAVVEKAEPLPPTVVEEKVSVEPEEAYIEEIENIEDLGLDEVTPVEE
jgi:hypothetical protein